MTKDSNNKIRVAIAGTTGYGGLELLRLLTRHPHVSITYLASVTSADKNVDDVYPHLAGMDLALQPFDPEAIAKVADIILMALPAGKSATLIPSLLECGVKVIDGGPDFRLKDAQAYPKWYKFEHPATDLLQESVFGIPEIHREKMKNARLVAQPGCFATATLLALAPLAKAGVIEPEIIVDAKTGLSGAGRTALSVPYLLTEASEDVAAYGFPAHRHLPEMEQELGLMMESKPNILFTPHLVPMVRGIFATVYVKLNCPDEPLEHMRDFYQGSPFVHVSSTLPHTKWTQGTNHAFLSARVAPDEDRAVLLSVLDNLGKGLSSQMVQCMNVMFGLEETAGLDYRAVYP